MRHHDSGGDGEPIVLLHGALLADWFAPLAAEPALAGTRRIRITRSGYEDAPTAATVADHVAESAALLRRLGVGPARVVGHSAGCVYALQLAIDHPGLVSELVLVEPPLIDQLIDPADRGAVDALLGRPIGGSMAAAAAGDLETAYDMIMDVLCGPEHRAVVTSVLGADGMRRALRDCGYTFTGEFPAMLGWTFDPSRVTQPVHLVAGGDSRAFTHRTIAHLATVLPSATVTTIPGHVHLIPLTAAAELAALVAQPAAVPALH